MKKHLFSKSRRGNQEGTALIFAFGMLILLMAILLGFSYHAMNSEENATMSHTSKQTRQFCDTAIEQLISDINKLYANNAGRLNFSDFGQIETNKTGISHSYRCLTTKSSLPISSNALPLGDIFDSIISIQPTPAGWENVFTDRLDGDGTSRGTILIGQFAYVAIDAKLFDIKGLSEDKAQKARHYYTIYNIDKFDRYPRLDLSKAGAATVTVANFTTEPTAGAEAPTTSGLRYLRVATVQAKQIAANIIDYSDSDDTATNDHGGVDGPNGTDIDYFTNPPTTHPTYVGLEQVPFINEIKIERSSPTNLNITPELLYMYDLPFDGEAKLTMTIFVQSATDDAEYTVEWATPPRMAIHTDSDRYVQFAVGTVTLDAKFSGDPIQVQVKSAYLTNKDGDLWDFAQTDVSSNSLDPTATPPESLSFQVDDPRQNTNASDWQEQANDTLGRKNTVCDPNPGGVDADQEAGSNEPWEISTAYIRNAAMQSLWELGAIHRGEKWQTLNLKSVNNTHELGVYADGDANILEQVMLNLPSLQGAVLTNLNSINSDVLAKHIFNNIKKDTSSSAKDAYEGFLTLGNDLAANPSSMVGDYVLHDSTNRYWRLHDLNGRYPDIVPLQRITDIIKPITPGTYDIDDVEPTTNVWSQDTIFGRRIEIRNNFLPSSYTEQKSSNT